MSGLVGTLLLVVIGCLVLFLILALCFGFIRLFFKIIFWPFKVAAWAFRGAWWLIKLPFRILFGW